MPALPPTRWRRTQPCIGILISISLDANALKLGERMTALSFVCLRGRWRLALPGLCRCLFYRALPAAGSSPSSASLPWTFGCCCNLGIGGWRSLRRGVTARYAGTYMRRRLNAALASTAARLRAFPPAAALLPPPTFRTSSAGHGAQDGRQEARRTLERSLAAVCAAERANCGTRQQAASGLARGAGCWRDGAGGFAWRTRLHCHAAAGCGARTALRYLHTACPAASFSPSYTHVYYRFAGGTVFQDGRTKDICVTLRAWGVAAWRASRLPYHGFLHSQPRSFIYCLLSCHLSRAGRCILRVAYSRTIAHSSSFHSIPFCHMLQTSGITVAGVNSARIFSVFWLRLQHRTCLQSVALRCFPSPAATSAWRATSLDGRRGLPDHVATRFTRCPAHAFHCDHRRGVADGIHDVHSTRYADTERVW